MQKLIVPIDIADEDVAPNVLKRAEALASGFEVAVMFWTASPPVPLAR